MAIKYEPGALYWHPKLGVCRFERWDDFYGQVSAEVVRIADGGRRNPLPEVWALARPYYPGIETEPESAESRAVPSELSPIDILRGLEWNAGTTGRPECPWCRWARSDGHMPDCRLAEALR